MGERDPTRRWIFRLGVIVLAAIVAAGVMIGAATTTAIGVTIVITVGGTILAALIIAAIVSEQARRKTRFRATAEQVEIEHGVEFHQKDPGDIKAMFRALPEVTSGGTIRNVIEGAFRDRRLYGFEHSHMVHTGQASIPVVRTIFAMESPRWPRVDILPNHALHAFVRALFLRRRLLLDLPEFNRRFFVRTIDPDFALTVLSPELQTHILRKPNVVWRLIDGWIVLIYRGALRLDRAPQSMERVIQFAELIPPELDHWSD